jgi:hypothetical protein
MPPYNNHSHSHSQQQHPSIPEKVYYILSWLTNPSSKHSLILYGPGGSGKSVALWEAIEQLKQMTPRDRPIPKTVSMLHEGHNNNIFTLAEHYWNHSENILEGKTIIVVTTSHLPHGMADLLSADVLKFERE